MKKTQNGFGVIGIVLVVIVISAIGIVGWKVMNASDNKQDTPSTQSSQQNTQKTAESEPDITLQNFGLASLDSVAFDMNAVREFSSNGLKGFYVFGDKLSGNRQNPNFEFASLKPGTKVVAAIDGIVTFIKEQPETKDVEVFLQPKNGSIWMVGYDHLVNVVVQKGDRVDSGDVLGEPAVQNNGLTRFEIQVNKGADENTVHICPSTLLASNKKDVLLAELSTMQSKWEATTKLELYDIAKQNPVGCIKTTLTPAEAEAR